MKYLKTTLFVIALMMLTAGSAFASYTYDVTVNTSGLSGTGYIYLDYVPVNPVASTATVSNFTTDGILGAQDTLDVVNGAAVTGTLPGAVVFANSNGTNDYEQLVTFGKSFSFDLTLSTPSGGKTGTGSTFSLGLFADAFGNSPLLNTSGVGSSAPGTLFTVDLNNNGTTSTQILASEATVSGASPTPIPPSALLLGFSLFGLAGLKQRIFG